MDAKLNHSDLSTLLAKETGITVAKAELLTKAMFDLIIEGLELDGIVKVNGLGTFRLTDVASRSSVNVNTGEKFEIKGHKKLTFTPADVLKDCVNQPFAMFEPVEVDDAYRDEDCESEERVAEELLVEETRTESDATDGVVLEIRESSGDAAADTAIKSDAEAIPEIVVAENTEPEMDNAAQKRPEPVMVHVPKKDKNLHVYPEKRKKSMKWLYITLSIILLVVAVAVSMIKYFMHSADTSSSVIVETATTVLPDKFASALNSGIMADVAVVDTTAAIVDQPAVEEDATEMSVKETVEPDEYRFVVTKELAMLALKDVTLADTVMYIAEGKLAEHKVVANETLTRIALKLYSKYPPQSSDSRNVNILLQPPISTIA